MLSSESLLNINEKPSSDVFHGLLPRLFNSPNS